MSADVYTYQDVAQKQRPPDQPKTNGKARNGALSMRKLAAEEIRHYTAPLPEAQPPQVAPFPQPLWWGLGAGVVLGAFVGLAFGLLLQRNLIVISGWEGLYSMAPGAFLTFWLFAGSALGILVGGVGTIIMTPLSAAGSVAANESSGQDVDED